MTTRFHKLASARATPWLSVRIFDRALGAELHHIAPDGVFQSIKLDKLAAHVCTALGVHGPDRPLVHRAVGRLIEQGLLVQDGNDALMLYSADAMRAFEKRKKAPVVAKLRVLSRRRVRRADAQSVSGQSAVDAQSVCSRSPVAAQSVSSRFDSSARNDSTQVSQIDRKRERERENSESAHAHAQREQSSQHGGPASGAAEQSGVFELDGTRSQPLTSERVRENVQQPAQRSQPLWVVPPVPRDEDAPPWAAQRVDGMDFAQALAVRFQRAWERRACAPPVMSGKGVDELAARVQRTAELQQRDPLELFDEALERWVAREQFNEREVRAPYACFAAAWSTLVGMLKPVASADPPPWERPHERDARIARERMREAQAKHVAPDRYV